MGCSGTCVFEIAWGAVFKSEGVQSLQTCPLALMTVRWESALAPWAPGFAGWKEFRPGSGGPIPPVERQTRGPLGQGDLP